MNRSQEIFGLMNNWKLTSTVAACGVVTSAAVAYAWCNGKTRPARDASSCPQKWMPVGIVSKLCIYPVKSLKGKNVSEAITTSIGLQDCSEKMMRDRILMVTDEKYVFQTQRVHPRMALVDVSIKGNTIYLTAPEMTPIEVHFLDPSMVKSVKAKMKLDVVQVTDCGDEVGAWIDKYLNTSGFRLVHHFLEEGQRPLNSMQKPFHTFSYVDTGALSDHTSYMIMTEESMNELNKHLTDLKMTDKNFRPTILIKKSVAPFLEDLWGFVKIGKDGPILKAAKPCTRCKLTTVDPDTGKFYTNGEPLASLLKLKRQIGDAEVDKIVHDKPVLGTQCGLHQGAGQKISVGDIVYAAVL